MFKRTYEKCIAEGDTEFIDYSFRFHEKLAALNLIVYNEKEYYEEKERNERLTYVDYYNAVGLKPPSLEEVCKKYNVKFRKE